MRDLLTILAGLIILVLAAALAVPPFIDWGAHRDLVDAAISRAAGTPAATEGTIDLRLLPSPRIRIEHLVLGSAEAPGAVSLDARFVRAEVALMPLLSGEVRFMDSRIGRAELKLPTGAGGDWRIPRRLLSEDNIRRSLVFDDLAVTQLLITTVEPATGRTDQIYAEGVRLGASALAGPWRFAGTVAGMPVQAATGELGADLTVGVKVNAGGIDDRARLTVDGKLQLAPGPDDTLIPTVTGSARLASAPPRADARAPAASPWSATAAFSAKGQTVTLSDIGAEAGEGSAAFRLGGSGTLDGTSRRLSLTLDGRRLDLDALGGGDPKSLPGRLRDAASRLPLAVELSLKLDSVAFGGEELTGFTARGAAGADGGLRVDHLDVVAPGATQVSLAADLPAGGGASGRVSVASAASGRLQAYLISLGWPDTVSGLLDGGPLQAAADFAIAEPLTSFRNIRLTRGDASITGALRYAAAEAGGRARLDAQLALRGLDLASVAAGPGLADAARRLDFGVTLDARDIGYGPGERGGRIAARIASDGPAISVEQLEFENVAGANASLSGRIDPAGVGHVAGRLSAKRGAPLLDLAGRLWFGRLAALVPATLADQPLDLGVTVERTAGPGSGRNRLRTALSGTAAGGTLDAEIVSTEGETQSLKASLKADRLGTWLKGATAGAAARPVQLDLAGARQDGGRFAFRLDGDLAGTRITTAEPFGLGAGDRGLDGGAADVGSDDLAPLIGPWSGESGPVPARLHLAVTRQNGPARLAISGQIAGSGLTADLGGVFPSEVSGTLALDRLSLPWLASALALHAPYGLVGGSWPTVRFGATPVVPPVAGQVSVSAAALDLGRGLVGDRARFDLATVPDGFSVRDLALSLKGGRVTGGFTITRQGGLAALIGDGAVSDLPVSALLAPPFTGGTLSAALRFGGSGESVATLVSNLGGGGSVEITGLELAGADPASAERTAARALRGDDPLNAGRLAGLANDELNRGPFRVAKTGGPATLVGGALRVAPVNAVAEGGAWAGSASVDFRTLTLDIRGALSAKAGPRGWSGPPPYFTLGWSGPTGKPVRLVDIGPLTNGLAAVVLTREMDRIETFELDAAERARLNSRVELDRLRQEAARQARIREEAEKARQEAEARARAQGGDALPPPPPSDIRPPGQSGASSGG